MRIKPLLKYDVVYRGDYAKQQDTFTAESYEVVDGRTQFFRTGNIVREYQVPLEKIVVTPVDEQDA